MFPIQLQILSLHINSDNNYYKLFLRQLLAFSFDLNMTLLLCTNISMLFLIKKLLSDDPNKHISLFEFFQRDFRVYEGNFFNISEKQSHFCPKN